MPTIADLEVTDTRDAATAPGAAAPGVTRARRRTDGSLAGRLNVEWARLRHDDTAAAAVASWARVHPALAGCASPGDVEHRVVSAPERADDVLLALVRLAHDGDDLAGRTVLQLMLGKALRIAGTRAGQDPRPDLEHAAISALWTTIATYPVERRPGRVAANIAMETLRLVSAELAHRRCETPASPDDVDLTAAPARPRADVELMNLLVWAVERGTVTAADATLVLDIYSPAPGESGGTAAAERHGLSWPAARQRASRAARRIADAVHADGSWPWDR
ncbi:hypothetical protein CLV30_114105 [Haloactinopolyspora alba]|uniref:Uncharacterized protein n=1 Tax=Haloactinopolyspora alba TaxID=648780 RepID=A0A2P8DVZ0_9ACTN|nr:hypothetical protein [Haloactinopolyspora alba]PSL01375.1 hypothetical protein CLV30_114105 [Haloactinopolyspora alba]